MSLLLALTSSGVNYDLQGSAGAYAVTGASAALSVGRSLSALAGSYSLTGVNASLTVSRSLSGSAGVYYITGGNAYMQYSSGQVDQVGGYYAEFWRKKWLEQWETKTPTVAEVIEFVQAEPEQAAEIAQVVQYTKPIAIDNTRDLSNNAASYRLAEQIILAIQRRHLELDEEDAELLLLM